MGIDVGPLWDFDDPAGSEARFLAALATADGDDALVLRTQVARTHGLRRDPGRARAELAPVAAALDGAAAEVRARYWLELGRTYVSAVTTPGERTEAAAAIARDAYGRALAAARGGGLDGLAIDAIHMLAIVDTEPEAQVAWLEQGLAVAAASSQPEGRRWEAALRNNLGMALHETGRHEDALAELRRALALREAQGEPGATRIGRWMVAWALRHAGQPAEALAMQLDLERELDAAGEPDAYVYEELELLYREAGDAVRAAHYGALLAAARGGAEAS